MFSLPFTINPTAIASIKSDLTKLLPKVKSSHRVEALARSLGYTTYASLRVASQNPVAFPGEVRWDQYDSYLREHGFPPSAAPLFIAVAKESIRQLLEKEPYLTMDGISKKPWLVRNDKKETWDEYKERFSSSKEEFFENGSIEQVLRSLAFIPVYQETEAATRQQNSYGLKHKAEKHPSTYPDGSKLGPGYVAQGAFVVAALLLGFSYREYEDAEEVSFLFSSSAEKAAHKNAVKKTLPGSLRRLLKHLSEEKISKIVALSGDKIEIENDLSPSSDGAWQFDMTAEKNLREFSAWSHVRGNLLGFIRSLNAGERMELTALMLIGRGDIAEPHISAEESFRRLCAIYKENMSDDHAAYLAQKPLHDYLMKALTLNAEDLVSIG